MKKILFSLLITCCFLLPPLSDVQAASGSREALALWQKMTDNSKTLQNFECETILLLNTSYNSNKLTIPVICKMNVWQNPLKVKMFVGSILPSGVPVNIDYYVLETGGNLDIYFKGIPPAAPLWQKMSVPILNADRGMEKELLAQLEKLMDKSLSVKLQKDEDSDSTLNKMTITVKNQFIYDILQLSAKTAPRKNPAFDNAKAWETFESLYRDYLSRMGDLHYTVWADKNGMIHKAAFDFNDNIKKGVKLLQKTLAQATDEKTRANLRASAAMLQDTEISCEFVYFNHNAAPDFTLPEDVKNAREIKLPAAPPPPESAQTDKTAA